MSGTEHEYYSHVMVNGGRFETVIKGLPMHGEMWPDTYLGTYDTAKEAAWAADDIAVIGMGHEVIDCINHPERQTPEHLAYLATFENGERKKQIMPAERVGFVHAGGATRGWRSVSVCFLSTYPFLPPTL
jgi:hypothetical protein